MKPPQAGPDVLVDPLVTVSTPEPDPTVLSLSALLAHLLAGAEIAGFPAVTAEQRGHWWRFLVRCASKALRELELDVGSAGKLHVDVLSAQITRTLAAVAPPGAWKLYQPEPLRPGFLQIPTPDGQPPGTSNNYSVRSVSMLTSTIGGKNHERKADVARTLVPEQAVYALVEYQLSAVFGGRGNYETQLMGSRSGAGSGVPFMGVLIEGSLGRSFRHDVHVMLARWQEVVEQNGLRGSIWALWAEAWDGEHQIGSDRLDPAFVPVARMVRLGAPDGARFRELWFRPTGSGRVRDHSGGGVLGDAFTPMVPDPKTGAMKVRGALRDGYSYREVVRLLFGDSHLGGAASPTVRALADLARADHADLRVVFQGTAYEQGKTGGFHRREVLLPLNTAKRIRDPDPVRDAHTAMLGKVRDAKNALRGATRILLSGSPKPRPADEAKTAGPGAMLEQRVDARYLEHLFEAAERKAQDVEQWMQPFLDWLARTTEQVFEEAREMLPTTTGRRWEREVGAGSYLSHKLSQLRGSTKDAANDSAGISAGVEDNDELVEEEVS